MRIELDNNINQLAPAMDARRAFSDDRDLDQSASQAAELVLDELLSNIIRYGGVEPDSQPIVLELEVEADHLMIRITDAGIPFNPFDRPPPDLELPLEQREVGGLGIHLVKHFMDEYSYDYRDKRNVVTLKKRL